MKKTHKKAWVVTITLIISVVFTATSVWAFWGDISERIYKKITPTAFRVGYSKQPEPTPPRARLDRDPVGTPDIYPPEEIEKVLILGSDKEKQDLFDYARQGGLSRPAVLGPDGAGGDMQDIALGLIISADFNDNDTVDFADFLIFARAFGKSAGEEGYREDTDLNSSGTVDFADFLIFVRAFGSYVLEAHVVGIGDVSGSFVAGGRGSGFFGDAYGEVGQLGEGTKKGAVVVSAHLASDRDLPRRNPSGKWKYGFDNLVDVSHHNLVLYVKGDAGEKFHIRFIDADGNYGERRDIGLSGDWERIDIDLREEVKIAAGSANPVDLSRLETIEISFGPDSDPFSGGEPGFSLNIGDPEINRPGFIFITEQEGLLPDPPAWVEVPQQIGPEDVFIWQMDSRAKKGYQVSISRKGSNVPELELFTWDNIYKPDLEELGEGTFIMRVAGLSETYEGGYWSTQEFTIGEGDAPGSSQKINNLGPNTQIMGVEINGYYVAGGQGQGFLGGGSATVRVGQTEDGAVTLDAYLAKEEESGKWRYDFDGPIDVSDQVLILNVQGDKWEKFHIRFIDADGNYGERRDIQLTGDWQRLDIDLRKDVTMPADSANPVDLSRLERIEVSFGPETRLLYTEEKGFTLKIGDLETNRPGFVFAEGKSGSIPGRLENWKLGDISGDPGEWIKLQDIQAPYVITTQGQGFLWGIEHTAKKYQIVVKKVVDENTKITLEGIGGFQTGNSFIPDLSTLENGKYELWIAGIGDDKSEGGPWTALEFIVDKAVPPAISAIPGYICIA